MWWVNRIMMLGVLVLLSHSDIRTHKISTTVLAAGGAVSVWNFSCQLYAGEVDVWVVAAGIAVGSVFLLVSRVTEQGMGYGDSITILILGAFLGLWRLLEVLCVSFLAVGICSVVLLSVKRMSRKCTIPFLPFLTGGYMVVVIGGAGV